MNYNMSFLCQPCGANSMTQHASESSQLTAYLGHVVSPINPTMYADYEQGALLVDESGKIAAVGPWSQLKEGEYYDIAKIVDFGKRLILPGFIDLHLHLAQFTQTGKSGHTLLGWLQNSIFPAEAAFVDAAYAERVSTWFFDELARNGTTTAVVFPTIHEEATDIAFRIAASRGNRVIMGKVLMDFNAPEALSEECNIGLKQTEELCKRWHNHDDGRLLYAFTPRFALTSTPQLLSGTARLWSRYPGTYLQTHLAENKEEIEIVRRQFANARSYLDVYDSHGLVGERSIFAHSIYIDDRDFELLKESGSAVAHCPSSNFFLKSGAFHFKRAVDSRVRFGLASDIGAGPEMSMFKVMKDAAYMQTELFISPRELFYLSTLAGAEALHLEERIGSLSTGKDADFIVVDPARKSGVVEHILQQPTDEILGAMIYMGDDRMIVSTFVRGLAIYETEETENLYARRNGERQHSDEHPAVVFKG
jgi:guanine deaminase